jgi:hypothetical protein
LVDPASYMNAAIACVPCGDIVHFVVGAVAIDFTKSTDGFDSPSSIQYSAAVAGSAFTRSVASSGAA